MHYSKITTSLYAMAAATLGSASAANTNGYDVSFGYSGTAFASSKYDAPSVTTHETYPPPQATATVTVTAYPESCYLTPPVVTPNKPVPSSPKQDSTPVSNETPASPTNPYTSQVLTTPKSETKADVKPTPPSSETKPYIEPMPSSEYHSYTSEVPKTSAYQHPVPSSEVPTGTWIPYGSLSTTSYQYQPSTSATLYNNSSSKASTATVHETTSEVKTSTTHKIWAIPTEPVYSGAGRVGSSAMAMVMLVAAMMVML